MANKIGYTNKNYNETDQFDIKISQDIISNTAFITARLFGGPIMMRDEIDPLITAETANGKYSIGRAAAETLAVNPIILSMTPGRAKALPFSSGLGLTSLVTDAISGINTLSGPITSSIVNSDFLGLKNNHMFYTMKTAYNDYMNHVNLIARIMSIYIGIGDELVPYTNCKFKEYNWKGYYDSEDSSAQNDENLHQSVSNEQAELSWTNTEAESLNNSNSKAVFSYYGNDPEDTIFGPNNYIHFYADANTSMDEDVSTGTRASAIQSNFENPFSDMVKDVQFLFGGASSEEGIMADINSLFSNLADSAGGLGDFAKAATNYLKGGRLIFPQMIDSSTYSKSITVGMKFSSPSGDPISVFLYCMLPLAHIMAFAYPQQIDNNMYTYPYMISCFAKGLINCDMGVITSARIQRGGSDDTSWSASGLATDIDVSLSITPLHNELMISSARHPFLFLQNYGLQEYLGTLCGVDMKGDSVMTQLNLIGTIFKNWVMDTPDNILRGLQDRILGSNLGMLAQGVIRFLTLP